MSSDSVRMHREFATVSVTYRTNDRVVDVGKDFGRIQTANERIREGCAHRIYENVWVVADGAFKAHNNRAQ